MLSTARSRALCRFSRRAQFSARRSYAFSANDKQEINDTSPPKEVPNVSKTNELPIETPHRDARISEAVEKGEELRVPQAPNRATVWSRSQNPRAKAMSGPRFEQTIMELQVRNPCVLTSHCHLEWLQMKGTSIDLY
jgi:NADH dehydrogenase (ubiquinone) Fe-S protein 6